MISPPSPHGPSSPLSYTQVFTSLNHTTPSISASQRFQGARGSREEDWQVPRQVAPGGQTRCRQGFLPIAQPPRESPEGRQRASLRNHGSALGAARGEPGQHLPSRRLPLESILSLPLHQWLAFTESFTVYKVLPTSLSLHPSRRPEEACRRGRKSPDRKDSQAAAQASAQEGMGPGVERHGPQSLLSGQNIASERGKTLWMESVLFRVLINACVSSC